MDRIEKALGSSWIGPVCLGLLFGAFDWPFWPFFLLAVLYVNTVARIEDKIAQAMETRRAETTGSVREHDSAVRKDAP